MGQMIYKVFDAVVKSVDEEALIVEHFISTETPDRHGDIVRAKGMQVKGKPVVLLGHGWDTMGREPIAKPLGFDKRAEHKGVPGIIAKTQFFDDDVGRRLFRKTTEGFMPNWSIGFLPIKMRPMQDDTGQEIRGRDIQVWELLEYSLVAVPAQPDAQTMPGRKKEGVSEIRFKVFDPAATEGVTLCPTCGEKEIRVDVDSEHGVGVAQECGECAAAATPAPVAEKEEVADALNLDELAKQVEKMVASVDGFSKQVEKYQGAFEKLSEVYVTLDKTIREFIEEQGIAEKEAEPAVSPEEGEQTNPQEREPGPDVIQGEEAIKLVASVAKRAMEDRVRNEINRMRGKVN